MRGVIESELASVVKNWADGRPIRTIELGHPVRVNDDGIEEKHTFRQQVAHEFLFRLLDGFRDLPSWPEFTKIAEVLAHEFKLTAEEQGAAMSLAWVALNRGWNYAIHGHAEHRYITLKREADA